MKQPIRKGPQLRTLRLDDVVWYALKRQPMTPNQFLRKVLKMDKKVGKVRR